MIALFFFIFAVAVQIGALEELDASVVIAVAYLRFPVLTDLMKTLTFFGTKGFLFPGTVVLTILLFLFFRKNRYYLAFPFVMLIAWFVMERLKLFFARPRPDFSPLFPESGYSFPSGHAFMGTLFFGFLSILIIDRLSIKSINQKSFLWWKRLVIIIACLFLLALGFSRIYLGVHYLTDVLAGYAGGLFFLSLFLKKPGQTLKGGR